MKNGFTLVELLAVIVILSAIVLITRPVILDIMNDAKNEVALRSAEAYLTIIEDTLTEYVTNNSGIEDGTYYIMGNGDICLGYLNGAKCSDDIVKIKVSKDVPNEGTIIYENNTVKEIIFVYNGQSIIKNSDGTLVFTEVESPYLSDSLVPVIYNGTNWIVVDEESNWYNYLTQEWANAVILKKGITKNVGDIVTVDGTNPDALAMYVWIPRYEYKIDGDYGRSSTSKTNPGEIEVNFISKKQTKATEGYTVHPAFKFGEKELPGIWVGKFELSHTTLSDSESDNNLGCSNENCSVADNLRVLPNKKSLRYNDVSNFFYAIRSMNRSGNAFSINSSKLDNHMIKNSEWAAVAYLSQSKFGKYGNSYYDINDKEIYLNNSSEFYTGRSAGYSNASYTVEGTYKYDEGVSLSNEMSNMSTDNDNAYPWDLVDGVYKSTNKSHNSTSNLSFSFSLENLGILSFDWSVSSESTNWDYVYYTIKKDGNVLSGTGETTRIGGTSYGSVESSLKYLSASKSLEPGNYEIIFTYTKDSSVNSGLDTAYIKNLKVVGSKLITKPQMGIGASTTGNITGVYDINGGCWEYVMGVFVNSSGSVWSGYSSSNNSGFTGKVGSSGTSYTGSVLPNDKYFDKYQASSGTTINIKTSCNKGICYGHALTETEKWYNDYNNFINSTKPWIVRSGGYSDNSSAGAFFYHNNTGKAIRTYSTRPVIAPIQ